MKTSVLRDMDRLEHSVTDGFYDKDLDMFFPDLNDWLTFKYNKKWSDII